MIKIHAAYNNGTSSNTEQEDHPQYDEYMNLLDLMKDTDCHTLVVTFVEEGLQVLFTQIEKP